MPSPSRSAWVVVAVLWVVALLNYLDRLLVTTMSGPIKADLGVSDAQFGLFGSAFLWVYGLLSPVAGFVADRFGRRRVIVLSLVVWSAVTAATGQARTAEEMIALRALMGVSEAFYVPAAVALIVEYHAGRTRSRATGLHLSGTYVGSILGGVGGALAEWYGWRAAFTLFGVVGVAYALVVELALPRPAVVRAEDRPPPVRPGAAFAALLGSRGFVLMLAANGCVGAAFWTVRFWLPTFFREDLGYDQAAAGWYGTSLFAGAAFAGMLVGSTLSDRWAGRTPRVRPLVPAAGLSLAAAALVAVGQAPAAGVVVAAAVVAGLAQGFLDCNLMPAVCLVSDPRYRATGYGLMNLAGTTAGGVMTFVGGWLKDRHVPLGDTFGYAAGFVLAAAVLFTLVRPAALPPSPSPTP